MKVGFLGLGAMGYPMARRLLNAGHDLTVFNRTAGKAEELLANGAHLAATPSDAARDAEVVFSMVFDDAATQNAAFDPDGIADGLNLDAVHVCCSTLSLGQARRLRDSHAERGQTYVSANVLRRPPAAMAGELFVIVGGAEASRTEIAPALQVFGQRVFVAGDDPVQANLIILSLNFLIMSTIEQMAEVFTLNEKAGTDCRTVFEIQGHSVLIRPCREPVVDRS